ncbi:MAG: serine/threonine-protein kinase [bacterium]
MGRTDPVTTLSRPPETRVRRARSEESGVLGDVGRSLRVACLVWMALWGFGLFMNLVVGPIVSPGRPLDDAWPWPAGPVAASCIVISAALFAYTKRRDVHASRVLDLALLYEVAIALGIGIVNQWTPNTTGLSWICVVILVHPLIVPAQPAKAFAAAVAAASMDLVGLGITRARGVEIPPASVLLWTYLPNFLCALLAVLPAHVRARLEKQREDVRELGSYRIGELLGRGGMGEVYRAEHRMLARPAAVKLVRAELLGAADPAHHERIVRRFEREARVTAGLRSPHTVSVYDYGITDDGTFYYVMELLEGLDLESLVRELGPVPAGRTVHILQQMCDSLAEAHEKGLIHRDIKPANVVLCRYGRRVDFVKVLDFGLARPIADGDGDARITREAAVAGTPAFMSPEQILGHHEIGPRTDLYAVGCVAYWLLTGALVFEGETSIEVLARHARDVPVSPSRRSELPIPPALDAIVMACLEKEPAKRPESAEALAILLEAVDTGADWSPDRARKWWEVHRPKVGAAGP